MEKVHNTRWMHYFQSIFTLSRLQLSSLGLFSKKKGSQTRCIIFRAFVHYYFFIQTYVVSSSLDYKFRLDFIYYSCNIVAKIQEHQHCHLPQKLLKLDAKTGKMIQIRQKYIKNVPFLLKIDQKWHFFHHILGHFTTIRHFSI